MREEEFSVEKWVKEGFKLGELKLWINYVRDPQKAKRFKEAGFLPSEARRWIDAGFESPEEVFFWTQAGVGEPEDAKVYREKGLEPVRAKVFVNAGISAQELFDFLSTLELKLEDAEMIAKRVEKFNRKRSTKVSMRDVLQYIQDLDVKDIDIDIVLPLLADGISVDLVKGFLNMGINPYSIYSLVSSGFTPEEYIKWDKAGFEPHEASDWKGVKCSIFYAERFRSMNLETSSIRALESIFERINNLLASKKEKYDLSSLKDLFLSVKYGSLSVPKIRGFQETELVELASLFRSICSEPYYKILEAVGFHNEFGMVEWAVNGFTNVCEAAEWRSVGFEPSEAKEWKKVGFSLQEALDAKTYGFKKAEDAYEWKREGFDMWEASEWRMVWLNPSVAKNWKDAGFTPSETKEWKMEGFEIPEVQDWASAGFRPKDAKEWKLAGFKAQEATEWRMSGFEATEAKGWKYYRYSPKDALRMKSMGYKHPSEIIKWQSAGFTLHEGGLWNSAGVEPLEVANWKSAGFGPYEAGEWKSAGFGPLEAREWSNAGYSPSTASKLKPYIVLFSLIYSTAISLLSSAGIHFLLLDKIELSREWSAIAFVSFMFIAFFISYVSLYPFMTKKFMKSKKM